jgi:hypothetical protein
MPTASDLVTDLPADFETFGQAVATSMADLLGGTTGQILSKASNTDMDFSWVTGLSNPMTTTGDMIYSSSGSTPARRAVGTTGQVLTVSGGVPTWATPATAAGMTLISTTTLSGTSTTISGFASTYTNLVLFIYGIVNATDNVKIRIAPNGSTNLFSYVRNSYLQTGSSATTAGAVGGYVMLNSAANKLNTSSQNIFGATFSQYANASSYKGIQGFANYQDGNSTDALETFSGYFETNTAITSLVITNDGGYSFSAGTALLYGV